ncbi:hypothetical protein HYS94_02630 [Candidatus Daviesbacteria bacterium]|nr:hypothetical protein [Candidatus Daviesbacteria bacterium]
MISDIVGWIGAGLVISAYFLVSTKKLPPISVTYQLMNLFGALGVGINVLVQEAYPSLAIQILWAMIAVYGLYKAFKTRTS